MVKKVEEKILMALRKSIQEASEDFQDITERRMFGCDAFFTAGQIYGLIWKEGRIGLRLPDPNLFAEAMSLEGSITWVAGNRTMSKWVLLPECIEKQNAEFRKWVKQAYLLARTNIGKTP